MDAQILKLAKQTNRQGLVDFLDSKSLDQVGNRAYKKKDEEPALTRLVATIDFATGQVSIDRKLDF